MKIKLEIDINELHLVDVPEIYNTFKIMQYGYAGTHLMETSSNGFNH